MTLPSPHLQDDCVEEGETVEQRLELLGLRGAGLEDILRAEGAKGYTGVRVCTI